MRKDMRKGYEKSSKMLKDTFNKLDINEIKLLPPDERGRYYESYIYNLIDMHGKIGLTLSQLEKISGITFNTLSKYLELLSSKRKLYRVKRGNMVVYFTNGKIHTLADRDLILKDDYGCIEKRYRFYLIENPEGEQMVYIQEKELDENGFENLVAGITIPRSNLHDFIQKLNKIEKEKLQLIDT